VSAKIGILVEIEEAGEKGSGTETGDPQDVTHGEMMTRGHHEETETYLMIDVQVEQEEEIVGTGIASRLQQQGTERRARLLHLRKRNLHRT
jgi:hypothetical protein